MSDRGPSAEWDALAYDTSSAPQQDWAADVLARLRDVDPSATVLDVGCGTGRVTEKLLELVPHGRVLAIDASAEMVARASARLGPRARIWEADALQLTVDEPVDVILSTATLHWVRDHDALWPRLAGALRPGGRLEVQCGGAGNIARVEQVIDTTARELAPELAGWSPWHFAMPETTAERLARSGFEAIRCWLEDRPTRPDDLAAFIRTSILPAHLPRVRAEAREAFAATVVKRVREPLDYVRLNVSAIRGAG